MKALSIELKIILFTLASHLFYSNSELLIAAKECAQNGITTFDKVVLTAFALSYSVMTTVSVFALRKLFPVLVCRAENRVKAVAAIAAEPPEKRQQRREQILRNGMKSRFKKGENRIWQLSAERQAEIQRKRAETWKKTRAMEISRVSLGLEQKTNFRLPKEFDQDKNKVLISRRYILRAKGYVIKRGSMAVYITPETVRSEEMERSAAKIGFVFRQV